MSDREKGIPIVLDTVFPEADQAYCCQHIADNIKARYGIKCVLLSWKCARAKTEAKFNKVLTAVILQSIDTGNYIKNIPYKYWAQ
jgi:hypothetical protein